MTESSIDIHLPDVWLTVPFELNGKLPINSLRQQVVTNNMGETKKGPDAFHQDPCASCIKGEPECDDFEHCSGNPFEKLDTVSDWYQLEIQSAITRNAKKRIDDEPSANLAPTIPANKSEAVSDTTDVEKLSAIAFLNNQKNKPYMSKHARNFMRHMGNWDGFSAYERTIMHLDFAPNEVDVVFKTLSARFSTDSLASELGDLSSVSRKSWFNVIHTKLNGPNADGFIKFLRRDVVPSIFLEGRSAADLLAFLEDFSDEEIVDKYVELGIKSAEEAAERVSISSPVRRLRREMGYGVRVGRMDLDSSIRNAKAACMEHLKPHAFITGGSSDIIDICWSPNGRRFALAATTHSDSYNRPGNLMLGTLDQMDVKLLDGHKTERPIEDRNPTLDNQLRSTVTRVAFSNDGCLLYSGGYDHTIKIWETEDGFLLDSVDLNGEVVDMALSKPHNVIAGSTMNGWLELFRTDTHGETHIAKFQEKGNLYASTIIWADQINPNWLFAVYDMKATKGSVKGMCAVYDASTKKKLSTIRPSSGRHFDMFLHQESSTLATGVSNFSKSLIRLYSVSQSSTGRGSGPKSDLIGTMNSPQKDINVITVSPCARFVTSSAIDGSTLVWDRRNLWEPLTQLMHEDTLMAVCSDASVNAEDTGTTFAQWCPHDGFLYTGSSDGVVKVWDTKKEDSLVRTLPALDAQIMSGSFSPDFDKLLIGSASGKATLYSMEGRAGEELVEFTSDMTGIIPDIDPDDGSVHHLDDDGDQSMSWGSTDDESDNDNNDSDQVMEEEAGPSYTGPSYTGPSFPSTGTNYYSGRVVGAMI
ncbi:WD40 repeat-like protein [Choiromyces venosus 120613-1]|uniref:WD40 repeat-like protein n=1 Tax=Choiromyces venosus 120613-1 TaxID=1336337 RepID=A0A3N4JRW5_9PEZI|nr:WD40 repeat-like protein [Choiromyces venosus 120613-1]